MLVAELGFSVEFRGFLDEVEETISVLHHLQHKCRNLEAVSYKLYTILSRSI